MFVCSSVCSELRELLVCSTTGQKPAHRCSAFHCRRVQSFILFGPRSDRTKGSQWCHSTGSSGESRPQQERTPPDFPLPLHSQLTACSALKAEYNNKEQTQRDSRPKQFRDEGEGSGFSHLFRVSPLKLSCSLNTLNT